MCLQLHNLLIYPKLFATTLEAQSIETLAICSYIPTICFPQFFMIILFRLIRILSYTLKLPTLGLLQCLIKPTFSKILFVIFGLHVSAFIAIFCMLHLMDALLTVISFKAILVESEMFSS